MDTSIVAGSLASWEYLDSYTDLMNWLRADGVTDADSVTAAQHYVAHGYYEGRVISFDAWEYLASNPDLMNWLRADGVTDADGITAAKHYIAYGYNEPRTITFDAWEYLASNTDLMNWLAADGVTDADAVAAAKHYIAYGYNEGRTIIFDSAVYLAANADLQHWIYDILHLSGDAANDFAAQHYIGYGRFENRMGTPVESYVLTTGQDIKSSWHFTSNLVGTVNTLQDYDQLTGLGDDVTLTAVLANPNAHAGYVIAPGLNNIKSLVVAFGATNYLSGLDLQHSDQALTNVSVTGVSSGGFIIENLYGGATNLSVADTQGHPDIAFTYLNHELAGIQTINLTLTNVYAHELTLGSNSLIPTEQIEHFNLVSNGDPTIDLANLLPYPGLSGTTQDLTITANAPLVIGEDWDGSGNVIEHDNAFTLDSVANLAKITVTATGSGDVTLASVGSVTGFQLDGSAAKGKIAVNISNAATDATAVFTTGRNDDTVLVDRVLTAFSPSGTGTYGSAVTFAGHLDTGSGNDSVTAHDLAAGTVAHGYAGAVITTGAGNDVVTVEKLLGSSGAAVAHDYAGASVNVGDGSNTVNADSLQTEARIFAGSGTDVVNLTEAHAGALYTVVAGDDTPVDADLNGAEVTLGAGDDRLNVTLTGTGLLDAGNGTVLITGYVDGGSGSDTLSITGNKRGYSNGFLEVVDGNSGHDVSGSGVAYDHAIVGVETLNLTSTAAYDADKVTAFNAAGGRVIAANDNDTFTADYALNRAEFDNNDTVAGSLTINLIHEAGVIRNIASGSGIYHGFAGDDVHDYLYNLTGTEVITISAFETNLISGGTGTGNVSAIDTLGTVYAHGAFTPDLMLDILHDASTGDKTAEITLNDVNLSDPANSPLDPGDVNYDVLINDVGTGYTKLSLTVAGADNHGIDLNNDFLGNLTVTGSGTTAGGNLTMINIGATTDTLASTITTSSYNGNVYLGIDSSVNHTITSGIGNDIVRLGDDSAIVLGNDSINVGSGDDIVIFNGLANGGNHAGLTNGDTVAGGAGNDVLAFGGQDALAPASGSVGVVLDGSGWTHVSGFETIRLSVGQASPVSYYLEITNQLVDDNGGNVLHLINNNAGTSGSGIAESNTTLDLVNGTGLNASNQITYDGAIGTGGNGGSDDRFIFNNLNLDGGDSIDGGAADGSSSTWGGNNDILEIRNSATVTAGTDLQHIYNVGHIVFNNTQVAPEQLAPEQLVEQTLTLDLTDTIVDNLVDSLHSSTVAGESETLYITANDHSLIIPVYVADAAVLHITATDLTSRSNLNIHADDLYAGNDIILTGGGADSIWGYDGNDSIDGGAGNDYIYGGDGNDTLHGGAGDDFIDGGAGNDSINGGSGNDYIDGGSGNDTIWGGEGNDSILGGAGNDFIYGEAGDDTIYGGSGNDYIDGGSGNDTIWGGEGQDTIQGGDGNDLLYGEAGHDSINGGSGNDYIDGGTGNDTIWGNDGNDTILGGDGNDLLYGEAGDNSIHGGSGDDSIDGGTGTDIIWGDDGADSINGGDGADTIYGGDGADTIYGGDGADTIYGGDGADSIFGGSGHDWIEGGSGINWIDGGTENDTILGGADADTILGDAGADSILGGSGHDWIDGGIGNDTIWGGDGHDTILGGDGNDFIYGEAGHDSILGGSSHDWIDGGIGNDTIWGGDGQDTILGGDGNDFIYGEAGADSILGGSGPDWIDGGTGNDSIWGGDGNDTILGGDGNDHLDGGAGADSIYGGAGADTISLGSGDNAIDTVYYTNAIEGSGSETIDQFNAAPAGSNGDILMFGGWFNVHANGQLSGTEYAEDGIGAIANGSGLASDTGVIVITNPCIAANAESAVRAGMDTSAPIASGGMIIVFQDMVNGGAVTVAYDNDFTINAGGLITIATLTGVAITELTADNFQFEITVI